MSLMAPETFPAVAGDSATYFMMVRPGWISAQMGAQVAFDARVDEVIMRRALRLLVDTEPVLGYRFDADARVPIWRRVETAEADDLLPVRTTDDPDADAPAFAAAPFDPCAGPQVRGVLLRSPDRDTLVLQVSHIAVDGHGVAETVYRLSEIHRALVADPHWAPPFNAEADRTFASAAEGVGFGERMGSMKSLAQAAGPGEWPGSADSGKRGGKPYVFGVIEPATFRVLKEKGRARGATVNDVVLNAYHRAVCRVQRAAPGTRTPIMMTADLREHLSAGRKRGLSGFAAFWGVGLSSAQDAPFDEALARVVEQTSAWKSSGLARQKAVASASADAMSRGWRGAMFRPMYTKMGDMMGKEADQGSGAPMFTNIGVIDEAKVDFGDRVRADRVRWFPPIAFGAGCLGAACYRERLEVCMAADPKATDPDLVDAIVSGMVEDLEAWAAA